MLIHYNFSMIATSVGYSNLVIGCVKQAKRIENEGKNGVGNFNRLCGAMYQIALAIE